MSDDEIYLPLIEAHQAALAGMRAKGPKSLSGAVDYYADDADPRSVDEGSFAKWLDAADPNHPLLSLWAQTLAHWDFVTEAKWTAETSANTRERRDTIYRALGLTSPTAALLDKRTPFKPARGPVVIDNEFKPWYDAELRAEAGFYWKAYKGVLEAKGWSPAAVEGLHQSTSRVVERLAEPSQEAARQAKGLVVGYVQSGKTANFTGVVAKGVDAGYRLIVVLTGTIDVLRAQTQRRIDMELVGQENIYYGADPDTTPMSPQDFDYLADADRAKFVKHGGLPSGQGAVDINRLTRQRFDYQSLKMGIAALEFEKREPTAPLWTPENLSFSRARLMVVKKNAAVLKKLVGDLKKIKTPLDEIPAIIIDDESDQASVNTVNPAKPAAPGKERSSINAWISELLSILPRAQYVGYTATPFANVFIDPSDAADLFPSDFILSLDRPEGYMGVQDFHDIDSVIPPEERTVAESAEKAHVRNVWDIDDSSHLRDAMDMYVLAGAIKLWRLDRQVETGDFRHHTMLIHSSHKQVDHRTQADQVIALWKGGGYVGSTAHRARLRALFVDDVTPVTQAHVEASALPTSFEELTQFIDDAINRIDSNGGPVVVVNGDPDIEKGVADFTQQPIWKILIGGAKLSRGFTVEGLTVTYFARKAMQADALMQMGRWFGFRAGYRDLVRLYIARGVAHGTKSVDLYEAFEAVCRDEERFREQLGAYAKMIDGRPQLIPAEIPPLVSQHLAWLKPAATNKMFNAELVQIRTGGNMISPTAYPQSPKEMVANLAAFGPIFDKLSEDSTFVYDEQNKSIGKFAAYVGLASHNELVSALAKLKWSNPENFGPHLRFLLSDEAAQRIDDWLLISPRVTTDVEAPQGLTPHPLHPVRRNIRSGRGAFGTITDRDHRAPAMAVATGTNSLGDPAVEAHLRAKRGAVLVYLVAAVDQSTKAVDFFPAFALFPPANAVRPEEQTLVFTTRNANRQQVVVPAP